MAWSQDPTGSAGPLDRVIAEYLQAAEAGTPPDRAALLAAHPELADGLREFFADFDRIDRKAAPLRLAADEIASGDNVASVVRYFGDYELIAELASGGMGVVFKARQVSLNRVVALKMILKGVLAGPKDVQRFRAEAEAAANLDHPNIVPIYEVGEHDGLQYFSMKFVEGNSLANQPRGSMREEVTRVAAVARAVHYAHQRGILHRDLKPSNVLLDSEGRPLVTDFGLAKRLDEADRSLTESGQLVGTPRYMAPEQARGEKGLTVAADIWALGAILYDRLTGRPPFTGDTLAEILRKVQDESPPRPSAVQPGIPRDLETVCLKCLEKDPSKRYGSANALAADLDRWLRGYPVTARPVSTVERLTRWVRRKPTAAAAYALSALAIGLVAIVVVVAGFWREAESARDQTAREKKRADEARLEAEALTEKLARLEYSRSIQLAHREWQRNNLAGAADLLMATRPDLRGWEWQYVHRLCHGLVPLRGHTGKVSSAAWSPDGSRVLTTAHAPFGAPDDTARIWDSRTGAELMVLRGHTYRIYSAAWSPDGARVLTASGDGTARVWDATTGTELALLPGPGLMSALWSPDGARVATTMRKGDQTSAETIRLWNWQSEAEIAAFPDSVSLHPSAWSPDGTRIVITSYGRGPELSEYTVRVCDTRTGEVTHTLRGHTQYIESVAWSPDGTRLVTAGWDARTKVWDARTGTLIHEFESVKDIAPLALWSPNGTTLLTHLTHHKGYEVWDTKSWKQITALQGFWGRHAEPPSFSPNGSRVLICNAYDGRRSVWDVRTGAHFCTREYEGGGNPKWSPDGQRILMSGAIVWDATTGATLATLPHGSGPASWNPDGTRILTHQGERVAWVLDARTGPAEVCAFRNVGYPVYEWNPSPDGKRAVSASRGDATARLWDLRSGTLIADLPHDAPPKENWTDYYWFVRWSPDGSLVETLAYRSKKLWDAKTGTLLEESREREFAWLAGFSPDGKWAVTQTNSGARWWDVRTRTTVTTIAGAKYVIWSPDSTRLLTTADDAVRVWDAASGKELAVLAGRGKPHRGYSWSPDGSRLLTEEVTQEKGWEWEGILTLHTLRVWDTTTWTELANFEGDRRPGGFSWSPDGTRLMVTPDHTKNHPREVDREVRVYQVGGEPRHLVTLIQSLHLYVGAAWSPDGTQIIITTKGDTIRERLPFHGEGEVITACHNIQSFDAQTGAAGAITTRRGASRAEGERDALPLWWNRDQPRLLAKGRDGVARVWDTQTWAAVTVLKEHSGEIEQAAWSPDGSRIVTVSWGGAVRVWDPVSGIDLLTLSTEIQNRVESVSWQAAGTRIQVMTDKDVWLWDSTPSYREPPPRPVAPPPRLKQ